MPSRKPERSLPHTISAAEFKARCLQLMDAVAESHAEIVITKYGKPVAKLVSADAESPDSFGALAGSVVYLDEDIVSPDHEAWGESTSEGVAT